MSRNRQLKQLWIVIIVALTSACEPEAAKQFDYGSKRPNFRLSLSWQEPQAKTQLLQLFGKLAMNEGLIADKPLPSDATIFESQEYPPMAFTWFGLGEQDNPDKVRLIFNTSAGAKEVKLDLIYFTGGRKLMSADDWDTYYRWVGSAIPESFPKAMVDEVVHPLEYTDKDSICEFLDFHGVLVPEKYQSELEC